jgi:hypothetical protein
MDGTVCKMLPAKTIDASAFLEDMHAAAGKPAPPGDPAQPHHDFVTRPDGGHNHVNH